MKDNQDVPIPFVERPDGVRSFSMERDEHLCARFAASIKPLIEHGFDKLWHHAHLEGFTHTDDVKVRYDILRVENLTKNKRVSIGLVLSITLGGHTITEDYPLMGVTPWGELLLGLDGGFLTTPEKLTAFRRWAVDKLKEALNKEGFADLEQLLKKAGLDIFGTKSGGDDPADWWKKGGQS